MILQNHMKKIEIIVGVILISAAIWFFTRDNISSVAEKAETQDAFYSTTTESAGEISAITGSVSVESQQINNIDNNKKTMTATMVTNKGEITLELFSERNPQTVENFRKLADSGFYNGVKFHRVILGFMIQGGDPLTKDDSVKARWGTGGPGYAFPDEITADNKNDVGTISMANAGPNTNGSQFFINVSANNFLDSKHTVFGKIVKGMDAVTAIENTPTDGADRPLEPVIIQSITIQ